MTPFVERPSAIAAVLLESGRAWKRRAGLGLLLLAGGMVSGCGGSAEEAPLLVFAAASTADVVGTLSEEDGAGPVRASFGPSSALARQILDGAPAGVFVSASVAWIRELERAGATVGPPRRIASNSLVCIAPAGSYLLERTVADASQLAAALRDQDLVAIADQGVPVGEYTRQSLLETGAWSGLEGRVVGQLDARDCLRAVQGEHAACGFVYASDVRAGDVEVLFELDAWTHDPVEVWAVATSARPEAQAFLERLVSARARVVLFEAGFAVSVDAP